MRLPDDPLAQQESDEGQLDQLTLDDTPCGPAQGSQEATDWNAAEPAVEEAARPKDRLKEERWV